MGHRAGDDVYGRIYTLDHPDVAPLRHVARILDDDIEQTIGSLLVPTVRKIRWGPDNPLHARADHVNVTLAAAGWQVEPGDPDDPLCDTNRVAEELGVYPNTARRWMADGTLPTVVAPDDTGVPRRWVRLSDVWTHRGRLAGRLVLPDVAECLGLRYHEAYHMLRRLDLNLEQHPTTGEYQLTAQAVDALRAETERIRALHRRSMKLAAAARELRMAASTVGLMAKKGELVVDPETDTSGARFVTRSSVQSVWVSRKAKKTRRDPVTAVPVAEVARFTGRSTLELTDLVRAGVLEQVPGRQRVALTADSLRVWVASLTA
jgi:hypothetical protein